MAFTMNSFKKAKKRNQRSLNKRQENWMMNKKTFHNNKALLHSNSNKIVLEGK